jgi:hypothetical protein
MELRRIPFNGISIRKQENKDVNLEHGIIVGTFYLKKTACSFPRAKSYIGANPSSELRIRVLACGSLKHLSLSIN